MRVPMWRSLCENYVYGASEQRKARRNPLVVLTVLATCLSPLVVLAGGTSASASPLGMSRGGPSSVVLASSSAPGTKQAVKYDVLIAPNMQNLPVGTQLSTTYEPGASHCVSVGFNTPAAVPPKELNLFVTDPGGGLDECSFTETNAQFRVSIVLPGGETEWTEMRLEQTSSPNIYYNTFAGHCTSAGNLNCSGGSDTSSSGAHHVVVPMTFGPLQTGPPGYTFCAGSGDECTFSGIKDVAFGADGHYNYKTGATSPVLCDFGPDPIYGQKKACFIK